MLGRVDGRVGNVWRVEDGMVEVDETTLGDKKLEEAEVTLQRHATQDSRSISLSSVVLFRYGAVGCVGLQDAGL